MLCTPCVCPVLVARHTPAGLQPCPQSLHQHTANAVLDVLPTCSQVPAAYSAVQASCEDQRLGGMAPDVHHSLHSQDGGDLQLPDRAQGSRCPAAAEGQGPPQGADMFL